MAAESLSTAQSVGSVVHGVALSMRVDDKVDDVFIWLLCVALPLMCILSLLFVVGFSIWMALT